MGTINIQTKEYNEFMKFDTYFSNISAPFSKNCSFYILWYDYPGNQIALINKYDKSFKVFQDSVNYVCVYDSNKVAILESEKNIVLYTVTMEELIQGETIKLNKENVSNFSINRNASYIVYEKYRSSDPPSIILRNIRSNTEKTLFISKYEKD